MEENQVFNSLDDIRSYFLADGMATVCLGATVDSFDWETHEATVSMLIDPSRHYNAQGFVMGGVIFTLADFALAISCNVNQPPTASISTSINYMNRCKGKHLIATARPDKLGRSFAFFTIDVCDELGTPVARLVATCARTGKR